MINKKCIKCLETKNNTEFFRDKYQIDGRVSTCKKCRKDYYKEHYIKNKEKYIKNQAEYKKNNIEKYKLYHNKYVMNKRFGISIETYTEMFNRQNGVCAICNLKEKSSKRMAIDHCHKTGKIRGLLCSWCNRAIGLLKDDVNLLKNSITYLTKNS